MNSQRLNNEEVFLTGEEIALLIHKARAVAQASDLSITFTLEGKTRVAAALGSGYVVNLSTYRALRNFPQRNGEDEGTGTNQG